MGGQSVDPAGRENVPGIRVVLSAGSALEWAFIHAADHPGEHSGGGARHAEQTHRHLGDGGRREAEWERVNNDRRRPRSAVDRGLESR